MQLKWAWSYVVVNKNRKLYIYTEGKSDVNFLGQYLKIILAHLTFIVEDRKEDGTLLEQVYDNLEVFIQSTGGYNGITKMTQFFVQHKVKEDTVLVIQDADSKNKTDGTFKKRMQYFSKFKKSKNIEFETFLFPNNKDDGDLETLLMKIVIGKDYSKYYTCYNNYQNSIIPYITAEKSKKCKSDKDVLYNYCYHVLDDSTPHEHKRSYDAEDWNFDHQDLKILQTLILSLV